MNRFLILILLAIAGSAYGQEPLSLADAIARGLDRNYDIRIERNTVRIAENNNNWGQAGRYPTLTLNVGQNNSITDNVKTANPFQLQGQIYSNSLVPSVNLSWVLFDGFRISINKQRFEQLEAESAGNASIVVANTIQTIVLGYYLAVLESNRLGEFKKQLSLSRDRYEYVASKYEIGAAVTSDVLLEEGNYLTDSVDYINQQLAYRNAVRNLNFVIGVVEIETDYLLTDSLESSFPTYAYGDLKDKMLNENVDLRKLYISQSILNSNVGLERANRYPSLTLNAGISENRGRNDLSRTSTAAFQRDSLSRNPDAVFGQNFLNPLSSITDNYFANFTLSYTLFNGGRINRSIKNAIIQEDIGNIRVDRMKISLERDLQAAYDQYEIRRQLLGINELREQAARTNLEISQEKFKNGSINSFDFRIVQNNYLAASTLKLQALYNLMDAKIALMRLTGGLLEDFED